MIDSKYRIHDDLPLYVMSYDEACKHPEASVVVSVSPHAQLLAFPHSFSGVCYYNIPIPELIELIEHGCRIAIAASLIRWELLAMDRVTDENPLIVCCLRGEDQSVGLGLLVAGRMLHLEFDHLLAEYRKKNGNALTFYPAMANQFRVVAELMSNCEVNGNCFP